MGYFKYRFWGEKKKPTWKEMHHYYIGLFLKLIGFLMVFYWPISWWLITFIMVFSEWLILDDYLQHKKQLKQWNKSGYWTVVSFWNWFPYTIYYYLTNNRYKVFRSNE